MVQLNEVYAPKDAMTDGVLYAYYVEEISAPNYSYQLAYDTQIDLAAGRETNTISMVNTRGVSIQVRVFGSVRSNRDDDTPVVEGAVLHIMKKDADGELHEVLLSDGQPYLYQTVTSDANGDVLFPYLPRLEEGEAYVVFEQPDAGAIGDDPAKPYLNPVSQGYKAYYDFKKTDANHNSTAEQDVSELDGAAGYYTVVTGEELMANPNELFSTLHFNAYNEPKGRLVILKRDYENKSALVVGAKFSAAEKDGMDEMHSYTFADLEPTAEDRTEAPQKLEIGEKTYTLAKDRTYYTDEQEYRYTYVITSYVERGKYAFAETTTPANYIETEASQSAGMPWHTKAEAELTNKGGFAAAAFANIPNRDPYLDKTVSAENGYLFAEACRKAGVPYAHHVFAEGAHGMSVATEEWFEQKLKERPDKWTEEEQAHIYGALDEVGMWTGLAKRWLKRTLCIKERQEIDSEDFIYQTWRSGLHK